MKAIKHVSETDKRAIRTESFRQVKEIMLREEARMNTYMGAAVLYALHQTFGFGAGRLKRFYDAFRVVHRDFVDAYAAETDEDRPAEELRNDIAAYYLAELKRLGVDVAAWREEEKEICENELL